MPALRPRKTIDGIAHLRCRACLEWVPETDFHIKRGLYRQSQCKPCAVVLRRAQRQVVVERCGAAAAFVRMPRPEVLAP